MNDTALVITSIACDTHPVLQQYAAQSALHHIPFIMMGDTKSPTSFHLPGCDYYSIERQQKIGFALAEKLPTKHYARKNLGYLVAIKNGANVIIETDDDNIPMEDFWEPRLVQQSAQIASGTDWVNIYKYFTDLPVWPRGFALERLSTPQPSLSSVSDVYCPIQQGLADDNPDVDAIYRLTLPLPITFGRRGNVALGGKAVCPFNSQNTTWFKEAFALLYLPSYCSFRMTDIWRSFIAQRIAQTCGWSILFHSSTVRQVRNDHSLMSDFKDEIPGYLNNLKMVQTLQDLDLQDGAEHISVNLLTCYQSLVRMEWIGRPELELLDAWLKDLEQVI